MKRHAIRLTGPGAAGPRVSLQTLRELADVVLTSAQQAVRLRAEGRGSVSGPLPAWLERASAVDLVALEAGSTQVILEAPTLAEAVPDRFAQGDFFSALDPNETAIDVLEESLDDALAENATSERFDGALVKSFAAFGKLFRHGIDGLEFDGKSKIRVDAAGLNRLERLQQKIPADQRVMIVGKIEMLRHTGRMFTVRVEDGTELRGVVASDRISTEDLSRVWGHMARVSGWAKYRTSGDVLRIEADAIEAAEDGLSVLSRVPTSLLPALDLRSLHKAQGPRSGVSAVMGRWPGDETDDEVDELLTELS
jgi:hypothetical protein